MRPIAAISAALILFVSTPASAQEWTEFVSREDHRHLSPAEGVERGLRGLAEPEHGAEGLPGSDDSRKKPTLMISSSS
jgi:hypothetical protein